MSDSNPALFAGAGAQIATAARMLREVVTALEALADTGTLVLWIEDLQWADPATMDVLTSLGQRAGSGEAPGTGDRAPDGAASSAPLRRAQMDLLDALAGASS